MDIDRGALASGRAAFDAADWRTAYDLLTGIDETTPLAAEDLDRVAEAAMWVGEHQACIAFGQRAFHRSRPPIDTGSGSFAGFRFPPEVILLVNPIKADRGRATPYATAPSVTVSASRPMMLFRFLTIRCSPLVRRR